MGSDELRTAFERELVCASGLELEGDFARALQTLEDFWEIHRTEDQDGWLRSAVRFHQGDILKDSGDLSGALKAFRAVNARPENRPFYLLAAYCLARTLDELGQAQEAFNELTHRLGEAVGAPGREDLGIVTLVRGPCRAPGTGCFATSSRSDKRSGSNLGDTANGQRKS